MKLARVRLNGSPVVIIRNGADTVALVDGRQFADLPELLVACGGDPRRITAGAPVAVSVTDVLSPLARPRKILCVGLNYRLHAQESNMPIPGYPVIFPKWDNAIAGPYEDIPLPAASQRVDWESELAFVIGRACRSVAAAEAGAVVFGYTAANDVSMRDWQFHSSQWGPGKYWDKAAPLGPVLVTADELGGATPDLAIRGYLNGQVMQDSRTSDFIFGVGAVVEYLSTAMTLEPGDLVLTGTPAGVGASRQPPQFLQPGDVYEVEIEGIGRTHNRFIAG